MCHFVKYYEDGHEKKNVDTNLFIIRGEGLWPFNAQCPSHIETSQLICRANQLTGFYMGRTLVVEGLRGLHSIWWSSSKVTRKDFYKRNTLWETGNLISVLKSHSGEIPVQSEQERQNNYC